MPTENFEESFGLPENCAVHVSNDRIGQWLDVSDRWRFIKDSSQQHPWLRWDQTWRFVSNPADTRPTERGNWYGRSEATISRARSSVASMSEPSTLVLPQQTGYPPCKISVGRPPKETVQRRSNPVLPDGSSILRTYEVDIELRSSEEGGVGVMFGNAIIQKKPPHAVLPRIGMSHERLSNLLHVPELSLVVAGSMCGRVALVTLTRPKAHQPGLPKRGFKAEMILPTESQEDRGLRPICPLLGVAVSPVFQADGRERSKRYRLMLHYYDLRILSYELSRDSMTDTLSILQR